jgi:hypothetical protein
MPNGDAQWVLSPGRMAAFDALSLKQLWADPDNYPFAKAVPPTIAGGKVIRATASQPVGAPADFRIVAVYGLAAAAGSGRVSGGGTSRPGALGAAQSARRVTPLVKSMRIIELHSEYLAHLLARKS